MTKKVENEKRSKAKKIYNIVSSIIVTFVFIFLVFALVIIIWGKVSGDNKPIFGKYIFDVVSGSMEPTIHVHESILCEQVKDPNILKEGDIITFIAPSGDAKGYNITHRIYHIEYNQDKTIKYIETKGDAAPEGDPDDWKLQAGDVKARYVKTLHGLGEFRQFLLTPVGYIVVIFIPLLVCGILFIVSFIKERSQKIYEKEQKEKKVTLDDLSEEEKKKLLEDVEKKDENKDKK